MRLCLPKTGRTWAREAADVQVSYSSITGPRNLQYTYSHYIQYTVIPDSLENGCFFYCFHMLFLKAQPQTWRPSTVFFGDQRLRHTAAQEWSPSSQHTWNVWNFHWKLHSSVHNLLCSMLPSAQRWLCLLARNMLWVPVGHQTNWRWAPGLFWQLTKTLKRQLNENLCLVWHLNSLPSIALTWILDKQKLSSFDRQLLCCAWRPSGHGSSCHPSSAFVSSLSFFLPHCDPSTWVECAGDYKHFSKSGHSWDTKTCEHCAAWKAHGPHHEIAACHYDWREASPARHRPCWAGSIPMSSSTTWSKPTMGTSLSVAMAGLLAARSHRTQPRCHSHHAARHCAAVPRQPMLPRRSSNHRLSYSRSLPKLMTLTWTLWPCNSWICESLTALYFEDTMSDVKYKRYKEGTAISARWLRNPLDCGYISYGKGSC